MELELFRFNDLGVRTIIREDEVWFVAKDVCRVLELGNSSEATQKLDVDEKGAERIDTPGGKQKMTIVNESGLYTLIIRSNKPQAKPFSKWVTNEVLPTIRKTGAYSVRKELTTLEILKITSAEIEKLSERNQDLTDVLLTYQKYGRSVLVREFIKIARTENKIEIKESEMWKILRADYFDRTELPYAKYMHLFEVIYRVTPNKKTVTTVKISPKGINYFTNKFLKDAKKEEK